ncbi:hypothetical protein OPT61_g3866 [Boeremia exigua]|uniref:Uncharacterized protein n=1 Tax=Boeremia exigua TaxID=749465 RepID=A0ACC2IGC0_9PLEO|nr:hypothetical protein OPT61_g3866 [Boeremia exigua]
MTPQTPSTEPHLLRKSRVLPQQLGGERVIPLSLLDATTANFALTNAIWLFERPTVSLAPTDVFDHLRKALSSTLNAYPQWCGFLKAILTVDGQELPPETASFPAHAKRYGRVYVHFGTTTDPGVEFIEATSMATVDSLYRADSARRRPIWNRRTDDETLNQFVPSTAVVAALEPNDKDTDDCYKPSMALQYTQLACGGLVLAAKIAHPLADITALIRFVQDWACNSRAILVGAPLPKLSPIFDPSLLDASAAGDINADVAEYNIIEDALSLPLHRYDWWAPPAKPPSSFPLDTPLAGRSMPWDEWDTKAPVDQYTIHFSKEQVDHLWQSAMQGSSSVSSDLRISKHDALLAHLWSCVVRARSLQEDHGPVHCDLVLGTRPALQFNSSFIGSPTMMLNIEMAAAEVASGSALGQIALRIRETISTVNSRRQVAAHLHSVAYEKSPQRIWQAFLGQRHILVTTWARAGIYDVDFGLGSRIRYADGVVPCLDGCILIGDAAPTETSHSSSSESGALLIQAYGYSACIVARRYNYGVHEPANHRSCFFISFWKTRLFIHCSGSTSYPLASFAMHLLLVPAAIAVSCNAFALPWTSRAVDQAVPALSLANFDTPKYARPLTLDEALSGANASVTTMKPEDLLDAKNRMPALVIPTDALLPNTSQGVDAALHKFAKRQSVCPNLRIRIEWDASSDSDRQGYIDAIKCLMNRPASGQFPVSRNRYDDLVGLHQVLTPNIHGNAMFLLWHRYYTWTFESLLRDECSYNGPMLWFDETRYAGNFVASSIFSDRWFGSVDIGGACVRDGQFADLSLVYGPGDANTPHCLARNNDNSRTINTGGAIVDACNNRENYADMAACAEGGAHAWGHNGIGAVMQDVYASPGDPMFFLHHSFVDRNFRIWQNNGGQPRVSNIDGTDTNGNDLTLDTTINVYGIRPDVRIGDILDTRASTLCYKYNY